MYVQLGLLKSGPWRNWRGSSREKLRWFGTQNICEELDFGLVKRLSEGLGLQRGDQPTSVQWQLKGEECHSSLQKLEMDLSCSLGGLRQTLGKDTFTRKVVQH